VSAYYAVFLRPGSRWDPHKGVREQPSWDEHARYMDALFAKGLVILGGPFADRSGSMVILDVESAEHARTLYRDDPWTMHDILVVADVKEWMIFLDARTKEAPPGTDLASR
jgi:uncharacterized protein